MNRRQFLELTAAGIVPAMMRGAAQPPNIVFILTDDLGYGDISCQNPDSKIQTPNIDRLAKLGMRFTDAHSPSAVCTPTRYGVLTGRYAWRSRLKKGVLEGYSPALIEPGRHTVPSLLKSRGYYTGGIGKWHLGLGKDEKTNYSGTIHPAPTDNGFDYYFGIPASLDMPPYVYLENDRLVEPGTSTTPGKNESGVFWRAGDKAPSFEFDQVLATLTKKSIDFIQQRAKKPTQPFFLYLPLTGPHTPWVPRKEFEGRSKAGIYGDFVCEVDWIVGQILDTLDKTKLSANTLLVLTSDNGPERYAYERIPEFHHYSMGALRGVKRDAWEGGHRVPFIARWPGIVPANSISNETICLVDLMATAAAMSGTKLPSNAGEDSYNILPALRGKKRSRPIREATVLHTANGEFAIRQGNWIFIDNKTGMNSLEPEWFRKERGYALHNFPGELYDLKQDPAESKNLYGERPDVVKKLKDLLEKYKADGRSAPKSA